MNGNRSEDVVKHDTYTPTAGGDDVNLTIDEVCAVFRELARISKKADPYWRLKYLIINGSAEEIRDYINRENRKPPEVTT